MLEKLVLPPTNQLHRSGLTVTRGWSIDLAEQIVARSRERGELKKQHNDMAERFYDLDVANEWFDTTQPVVYSLARAAELAGIIWYNQHIREDIQADYKLDVRLYGQSQRDNYAELFAHTCDSDFRLHNNPQAIWMFTDGIDGAKIRNAYLNLGYGIIRASNVGLTLRR